MDQDWLARQLEAGKSYESIAAEAGCSASKVSYWANKHGLSSSHVERHAGKGPIDEALLVKFVERGDSIRDIAAAVSRSPTAVRHRLKRLGLTTLAGVRIAEGAAARATGETEPILTCPIHGRTRHVKRHGGFRCQQCRSGHVASRRRRVKAQLVAEAGGACVLCGYDRFAGALQFHHIDPATKLFAISDKGVTRSIAAARTEAQKCVLLCANCHAEVERGIADVSVRSDVPGVPGSAVPDPG